MFCSKNTQEWKFADTSISLLKTNVDNICNEIDGNYTNVHGLPQEELSYCHTINEMTNCIHGPLDISLSREQCKNIIDQLATM